MEKQENLSQSKYAEHRNVTKGYIGRLVKEGRLHAGTFLCFCLVGLAFGGWRKLKKSDS